jgi:hypothetical protein
VVIGVLFGIMWWQIGVAEIPVVQMNGGLAANLTSACTATTVKFLKSHY